MAADEAPYRRRFLALEALLVVGGIGLALVAALQVRALVERPAITGAAFAAAAGPNADDARYRLHLAEVARESERLPTLFATDAEAAALGLEIIPNAFDLRSPPSATSVFHIPLPGQAPASSRSIEFFEAGFVLGRAQSFQRVTGQKGRLSLIVWAFRTPTGAERAFRAYRDMMGIEGRPVDYAPLSALKGHAEDGLEELFWVRGRLLIQSSWAIPQTDTRDVRAAHAALTELIDREARRQEPQAAPVPGPPDLSPLGRVAATRVPDVLLPGGYRTEEPAGGATADPLRGWQAAPSLDVGFSRLGLLGTHRQVIRVQGMVLARFELAAQHYPDARRAAQALALVGSERAGRPRTVGGLGPAIEVRGPGGANYSDLWWRRGPLLLRASLYSSRLAPLDPAEQRRLARLLDRQARTALATLHPAGA
jgi:hypothetical protein